jgi:hypothetical protein
LPLYKNEGYLFLYEPCIQETRIYQFNLTIFENNHEKCRGLKTFYVDTIRRSMANTFENMKIDLVKKYRHLPNPATFFGGVFQYFTTRRNLFTNSTTQGGRNGIGGVEGVSSAEELGVLWNLSLSLTLKMQLDLD